MSPGWWRTAGDRKWSVFMIWTAIWLKSGHRCGDKEKITYIRRTTKWQRYFYVQHLWRLSWFLEFYWKRRESSAIRQGYSERLKNRKFTRWEKMKIKSVAVLGAGAVGSYVIWGLSEKSDIRLGAVSYTHLRWRSAIFRRRRYLKQEQQFFARQQKEIMMSWTAGRSRQKQSLCWISLDLPIMMKRLSICPADRRKGWHLSGHF